MKRALVLLTAAIPALAIAKPPAWFQDGVGEVAFSGTVELPLYRGPQTDYLPTIFVDVPAEEEGELGIVLESELSLFGATRITTGAAAELGLKVKDGTAVIPELHIGDALVLYDVRAKVSTPSEFDGADSTDLWLGVNAIDEIAVAVLPSTGTIRIVPSSEAASLLSGVGTPIQASVESDDKFWHRGHKVQGDGLTMRVGGNILGTDGEVEIGLSTNLSKVSSAVELPSHTQIRGGLREVRGAPVVAGLRLESTWFLEVQGMIDANDALIGVVGYDVLYNLDIAIDPTTDQIALAPVEAPKWTNPHDVLVARATAVYDDAKAKAEEAKAEAPEEASDDGDAGKDMGDPAVMAYELAYARELSGLGVDDKADEHFKAAVAAAGEQCEPFMRYGKHLLWTGRAEEAVEPLQTSADRWQKWWSQDLDTRQRVAAGKKVDEGVYDTVQDSSCHLATGDLAWAYLALGKHDEIAALYGVTENREFDSDLPGAYGLSLLAQGQTEAANGPLRQALGLGARQDSSMPLALGFVYAGSEGEDVVERQTEFLGKLPYSLDLTDYLLIVELGLRQGGKEGAVAFADKMVALDTLSVPARIGQAFAHTEAGNEDDVRDVLESLDPMVKKESSRLADSPAIGSSRAIYLALKGEVEEAQTVLETLASQGPRNPDYWMAKASVHMLAGESDKSAAALEELTTRHPYVPFPLGWKGYDRGEAQ